MNPIKKTGRFIAGLINRLCEAGHILGEISTFFLLVMVFYSVVMRYVFNAPPEWVEEIGCYILILAIWLSIGEVLKHDHHITLDLAIEYLSPKKKIIITILTSIVGLTFCIIITYFGIKYVIFQHKYNFRSSTLLSVPLWIPYLFIPLGSAIISLEYIVKISDYINTLTQNRGDEEISRC